MSKQIKLSVTEEQYTVISKEAKSKMQTMSGFIKLCIASYINKRSQGRAFGKND